MGAVSPFLGVIAGVLGVLQAVPYLISIFAGETKPNRATYAIWSAANCVGIASYIASGASTTIWYPLATTLTGLVIFALSFKYGMGGVSRFDVGCLMLAVSTGAVWIITSDPALAVYASCATGLLGYLPTMLKAARLPHTENRLSWIMTAISGTLNFAALTELDAHIMLPPTMGMLCPAVVVFFLLRRRPSLPGGVSSGAAEPGVHSAERPVS